jgi:hypothetical protein
MGRVDKHASCHADYLSGARRNVTSRENDMAARTSLRRSRRNLPIILPNGDGQFVTMARRARSPRAGFLVRAWLQGFLKTPQRAVTPPRTLPQPVSAARLMARSDVAQPVNDRAGNPRNFRIPTILTGGAIHNRFNGLCVRSAGGGSVAGAEAFNMARLGHGECAWQTGGREP